MIASMSCSRRLAAASVSVGPARQQADQAAEVLLLADGQVQRRAGLAERGLDAVKAAGERGPVPVKLVDEEGPGQAQLLGHGPDDLGLGLHPLDRRDHEQHRVGRGQGRAHVADEVGVAGGVEQVDLEAVIFDGCDGQGDRDLLAGLLGLEVGHGGAVLDPPDAVGGPGGMQHRLDQRGLAGAPVTNDQDVADTVGGVALHRQPASLDVAGVARERRCYHRILP
jgi:hypothetical protein